nr:alpha-tocopherol transfer protein-like [Helicoverpa armigera]
MGLSTETSLLALPDETIEKIRKTFNLEKPERRAEAVKILQEWLQKQDHIIKKDFSDDYLERVLITCKGSVEKAKKQIDRLCTLKTLLPKFFAMTNVKTDLPEDYFEDKLFIPLPQLTKDLYRVVLLSFAGKQITSEVLWHYFQFSVVLSEYMKLNDYLHGIIIVYDFRHVNLFDLVTKLNTVELQQFVSILVEGFGARLKSIQVITESKAVEILINIVKQVVSEKIGKRFVVQNSLEGLYKVVPKEILPVEYGGDERSAHKLQEEIMEELSMERHVKYMEMMSKACTDETKRHAGKFNEEYMGMPGSFRNLSVD